MFPKLVVPLLLSVVPNTFASTVYLAGDSTMAKGGGGSGTDGWGQYLAQYITLPVVNKAVAGRSARSYTEEGRFDSIINTVQRWDYVIIEFGHNDGFFGSVDNGRQDAPADGYQTTKVVTDANGNQKLVHSFVYYIQNAVKALQAKGAIPILSSQTPDNIWSDGSIKGPSRFVGYMLEAAEATGAIYIDHYRYVAQAYNKIGRATVATYFPNDHTHTSPAGALVVAEAFVRALLCGKSEFNASVNTAGWAVPNGCLE